MFLGSLFVVGQHLGVVLRSIAARVALWGDKAHMAV
jgi:hypothetical protein